MWDHCEKIQSNGFPIERRNWPSSIMHFVTFCIFYAATTNSCVEAVWQSHAKKWRYSDTSLWELHVVPWNVTDCSGMSQTTLRIPCIIERVVSICCLRWTNLPRKSTSFTQSSQNLHLMVRLRRHETCDAFSSVSLRRQRHPVGYNTCSLYVTDILHSAPARHTWTPSQPMHCGAGGVDSKNAATLKCFHLMKVAPTDLDVWPFCCQEDHGKEWHVLCTMQSIPFWTAPQHPPSSDENVHHESFSCAGRCAQPGTRALLSF